MDEIQKDIRIVPASIELVDSYTATLNEVAAEGKYLSTTGGYKNEETAAFIANCISKGFPAYFVLDENERVVGWCDIVLRSEYTDMTTGSIGVGLLEEYRNAGVGRLLMHTAMQAAKRYGFERIILDVRKANSRAIHVYEVLGFEYDHSNDSTMEINGEVIDVIRMQKSIAAEKTEETGQSGIGCAGWLPLILGGCAIGAIIAVLCILIK